MKENKTQTVVITGSARGFGLCQAKKFKEKGFNVVISDINEANLAKAMDELSGIHPEQTRAVSVVCDVTRLADLENLWSSAVKEFGSVDIWINNAGVNSPDKPVCELTDQEIAFILDVDLKGTILGSKVAFAGMKEQGYGQDLQCGRLRFQRRNDDRTDHVRHGKTRRHLLHPQSGKGKS